MAVQNQLADHNMLGDGQVAGMYPMPQAQPAAAALAKAKIDADAAEAAGKMVSAPAQAFDPSEMNFAPAGSYPTVANPNPAPLEAKADNSMPVISPLLSPVR
jgi:hypothetical protein